MLRSGSLYVLLMCQILSGCVTTVQTREGENLRVGSEPFREHAIAVFKRQNSALTALFDVFDLANEDEAERLDFAEQRMINECETLNSAAAKTRDGKTLGAQILLTISSTIRPCEDATFDAEQLIRKISPEALPNSR